MIIAKIKKFYGGDPRISPDYCRIVTKRHLLRLKKLLDQERIISGGDVDETNLYIAPTGSELQETARLIHENGGDAVTFVADVTEERKAQSVLDGVPYV